MGAANHWLRIYASGVGTSGRILEKKWLSLGVNLEYSLDLKRTRANKYSPKGCAYVVVLGKKENSLIILMALVQLQDGKPQKKPKGRFFLQIGDLVFSFVSVLPPTQFFRTPQIDFWQKPSIITSRVHRNRILRVS